MTSEGQKRSFPAEKGVLGLASRLHSPFCAPRETGAEKEEKQRDIREMEAESVSLLCCESLGLPGAEYSRGYIQSWGRGQTFTERSAQRIFRAADQIHRAGYPGKTDCPKKRRLAELWATSQH